ncbi:hypothetical protein BDQ12DRAFT_649893 [Crucibulum laeve]|uniref:Peptidase S54 rhomboid domain-containing protein n=1 Tax=Crucibulum laeve TaxID=68775 RepID=A0A5C3ME70_9AGAR|nr:hypothetical protein BDQ12DRAFT_649893 [Crucibulum laeve]
MLWTGLRCSARHRLPRPSQSTRSFSFTSSSFSWRVAFRPTQLVRFPRNVETSGHPPHPPTIPGTATGKSIPTHPSFREGIAREVHAESFADRVGKPGMRKQLLFFLGGSLLVFSYGAVATNIETEYWREKLSSMSTILSFQTITSLDLKRAQNAETIQKIRTWFNSVQLQIQSFPGTIRPWISLGFVSVLQPYIDASEGKRLCWKICLFNAGIWVAWQFTRLQPRMRASFTHNPLSGKSYTLLTSMFSHKSFFHLLFNCLALESFGSAAYYYLVREQGKMDPPLLESTSNYQFSAFFISAGLFSGLVSHIVSAKFMYPRLISKLAAHTPKRTDTWAAAVAASSTQAAKETATKEVGRILPSLGASGAIYAAVTMSALAFPTSEIALFIPPSYPINIQTGVSALVLLDVIGVLRGWRMFDHWAHLGGAAFGVAYYAYGPSFWHYMRRTMSDQEEVQVL